MDNFILDQGMEILEGRFRVIKRLGNGAFGEIYKVEIHTFICTLHLILDIATYLSQLPLLICSS